LELRSSPYLSFTLRPPPRSTLFPTRRSSDLTRPTVEDPAALARDLESVLASGMLTNGPRVRELEAILAERLEVPHVVAVSNCKRSEEHTSELQSRVDLVCRLLLEKKNKNKI